MFKNDYQRAAVCDTLCKVCGLEGMWEADGPTELGIRFRDQDGGPLSSGERIMFLASWNVWNGDGAVTLADVLFRLDNRNLRAIAGLILAMADTSGRGIDRWLAEMEAPAARSGHRR